MLETLKFQQNNIHAINFIVPFLSYLQECSIQVVECMVLTRGGIFSQQNCVKIRSFIFIFLTTMYNMRAENLCAYKYSDV